MIQPWKSVSSQDVANFGIFKVRADLKQSPRTGRNHKFYVIQSVNWVNVLAVTPSDELVMVEHYRHGSNSLELELPGGTLESSDASPAAGAARELREETGYEGRDPRIIGQVFANPAILDNSCFTVLVEACEKKWPVELDDGEDMVTRLVPISKIPEMVAANRIGHSLVVVALYQFELWRRGVRSS
jgi:ADP-ribose pyrophosphatase